MSTISFSRKKTIEKKGREGPITFSLEVSLSLYCMGILHFFVLTLLAFTLIFGGVPKILQKYNLVERYGAGVDLRALEPLWSCNTHHIFSFVLGTNREIW